MMNRYCNNVVPTELVGMFYLIFYHNVVLTGLKKITTISH